MSPTRMFRAVVRSLVLSALGCGGMEGEITGTDQVVLATALDEAALERAAVAAVARYRAEFFTATPEPVPSKVAVQSRIRIWGSPATVAAYAQVNPNLQEATARLSPGAVIVREILDAAGTVTKLTLIVQGSEGYAPEVGNLWFGVMRPDGRFLVDGGKQLSGRLAQCAGCHQGRAAAGYLFGVPPRP